MRGIVGVTAVVAVLALSGCVNGEQRRAKMAVEAGNMCSNMGIGLNNPSRDRCVVNALGAIMADETQSRADNKAMWDGINKSLAGPVPQYSPSVTCTRINPTQTVCN